MCVWWLVSVGVTMLSVLLCTVLLDCVTRDVVFIIRVIIALCFLIILLSLAACLMDVFGPTHVVCRAIRFTASVSILSGSSPMSSLVHCTHKVAVAGTVLASSYIVNSSISLYVCRQLSCT